MSWTRIEFRSMAKSKYLASQLTQEWKSIAKSWNFVVVYCCRIHGSFEAARALKKFSLSSGTVVSLYLCQQ
jgi:hypothetical protein